MKLLVSFLLFILFSIKVSAQETSKPINDSEIVFTKAQVAAEFVGGVDAWREYLINNLKTDAPAQHGAPAGKYKVIVNFIVDREGSIKDVSAESNPGYGCAEEAIRIIKNSPPWKPAIQNGYKVNFRCRQAISFMVEEEMVSSYEDSLRKEGIEFAEFLGGVKEWQRFLAHNLKSDVPSNNSAPVGKYSVVVSFTVDKNGKLSDINLVNDPGYGTGKEAVRVMTINPDWKPAQKKGYPIVTKVYQKFTFVVSEQ